LIDFRDKTGNLPENKGCPEEKIVAEKQFTIA
jgi:hypothetical protein